MDKIFKFRAKVVASDKVDAGRIVFGSLVDYGENSSGYRYWIHPPDGDRNFPVDENSITQFVGFDKDGNEVYDGDPLIGPNGRDWTACLNFTLDGFSLVKEGSK